MAPAPSTSTLRPARAAHRYRRGQGPKGQNQEEQDVSQESSDDDEVNAKKVQAKHDGLTIRKDGLQVINQGVGAAQARTLKVQVKEASIQPRIKQESDESASEEESEKDLAAPPKSTYRNQSGKAPPAAIKEESSEYESSEEEESEDEAPPASLYKPVFVSKRNRDTVTKDPLTQLEPEELELKQQSELEERRRQSTLLAGEAIKRELAEKDTSEIKGINDVDDTDGLDDQSEFESWKLRELMRIKRERESDHAREKEREEIEARRALPDALRLKEDTEYAASLRAAKSGNRGNQNFLQKYHHKGAFFADSDVLHRYDYSAPTESAIRDVSSLPEVMQVRNFGKMGRTKYTHLVKEDTTDRAAGWAGGTSASTRGRNGSLGKEGANAFGSGCFNCGGNHLKVDCPQLKHGGPSGANASALRVRRRSKSRSQERERDKSHGYPKRRSRSPSHNDSRRNSRDGDSYRPSGEDRDRDRGSYRTSYKDRDTDRDREDKRRRRD